MEFACDTDSRDSMICDVIKICESLTTEAVTWRFHVLKIHYFILLAVLRKLTNCSVIFLGEDNVLLGVSQSCCAGLKSNPTQQAQQWSRFTFDEIFSSRPKR